MQITVKLFATLRTGRFKTEVREYPQGTSVFDVAEDLQISKEELALMLVNGISIESGHILQNKDTLAIFPPVGGG